MNAATISALSALAGSAIGALASLLTTWMTQHFQDRTQRLAQTVARRERLYGDFIDEASRVYADALTHRLEDASKLVGLYAIRSKLVLFAAPGIIEAADRVMEGIVAAYRGTPLDLAGIETIGRDRLDLLRGFAQACRTDLSGA